MDPIKAKFYQATFTMESGGHELAVRGLISEQGVTKIHLHRPPSFWESVVGQTVNVTLDQFVIRAEFHRQFVEFGSHFELRFVELAESPRAFIRQRILAEGISPGWQRQFPRIPVSGELDLPVPTLCLVYYLGREVFVDVVNFTLGGLKISTTDLAELRVGAILQFDLGTSTGFVLPKMYGEVRNISSRHQEDGQEIRGFGLKLVNLDPVNERLYKSLIKDYCLELQKRQGTGS